MCNKTGEILVLLVFYSGKKKRNVLRDELYYDSNIFIKVDLCAVVVSSHVLLIAITFPSDVPPPLLSVIIKCLHLV